MLSVAQAHVSLLCDFTLWEKTCGNSTQKVLIPRWDLCRWGTWNQTSLWAECSSGLYYTLPTRPWLFLCCRQTVWSHPAAFQPIIYFLTTTSKRPTLHLALQQTRSSPEAVQGQPAAWLFVYFGWHFPLWRIWSLLFSTYSSAYILCV